MANSDVKKFLINIVGPTAIGKTALSLELAGLFRCPVISADSRQVFKEMNIGTAKVTHEEMERVPHYLVDELAPDEEFSAGKFVERVEEILAKEFQQRFAMIMCGGSGFYLQGVWEGLDEMPDVPEEIREELNAICEAEGLETLVAELEQVDPETHAVIDQRNPVRVIRALEVYRASGRPISEWRRQKPAPPKPFEIIKIGLTMDRPALYARIEKRVDAMLEAGLIEEARGLFDKYGMQQQAFQSVGYQELIPYFKGEYDLDRAVELLKRNSRRLAKRQYTWFRRYDDIAWFEFDEYRDVTDFVLKKMGIE